MARSGSRRSCRPRSASSPYFLIASGPDKRLRSERFADADSYKARLAALQPSDTCSVSIDEVAGWLDEQANRSGQSDKR